MSGYLSQFIVYTIAMTGLIFMALMVYKKVSSGFGFKSKSNFLRIEDTINLSPRKNLYVVRAGKEKFLIASDVEKTTLISKLEETADEENPSLKREKKVSVTELPDITAYQRNKKLSVLKKIADGVKTTDFNTGTIE